ncbi:MAG: beta strand repeat-containing protein [Spirulina sp.]
MNEPSIYSGDGEINLKNNGDLIHIFEPLIRSGNGDINITGIGLGSEMSGNLIYIYSSETSPKIIESTGSGNINIIAIDGVTSSGFALSSIESRNVNFSANQGQITIIARNILNDRRGDVDLSGNNLYTNGQDITIEGNTIKVNILNSSSLDEDGGDIKINSTSYGGAAGVIDITGPIDSSGGKNGGHISIEHPAFSTITIGGKWIISSGGQNGGNISIGNANSNNITIGTIFGDINSSGGQNGGNISIGNANSNNITINTEINSSGGQSGSNVSIRARNDITTRSIRSDSFEIAGNISINAIGNFSSSDNSYTGTIDTTAGIVSAGGGTQGGNIQLRATSDINTGTITLFNPSFNGDSGKIDITSIAGNIDTIRGSLITSSALGQGGNITLTSERKDITLNSGNNQTQLTFGGNVNVADINAQSIANQGGAISITADRAITTQGDITTNDNSLTFDGTVNLADNNTFKIEGNGNITFGSTLDGNHELTLDAQTVTLEDSVGATTSLDRLTVRNGTVLNDTTATNVTARQDISVSHIDSKQAISLNSLEGEVTTGNLK